jgi:hypothetical protein
MNERFDLLMREMNGRIEKSESTIIHIIIINTIIVLEKFNARILYLAQFKIDGTRPCGG